jgi:hypothetical protein
VDTRTELTRNSYYGPATVSYFQKQLAATDVSNPLHHLTMDTLGITNGCIDQLYHAPSYPEYAYNNTYGVQFIPEPIYKEAALNFTKPGGCKDLTL